MRNYELEEYIKNNIGKIMAIYKIRLKDLYNRASIEQILENEEDIRFLKYIENKNIRIGVVDVTGNEE